MYQNKRPMQATETGKKDEVSMEVEVIKALFQLPNRSYSGENPSLQDLHLLCFPVDACKLLRELIDRMETHQTALFLFLIECRKTSSTFFYSFLWNVI